MINIWLYLLAVVIWIIQIGVLVLFPNATNAINFAAPMVQGFIVFCELAYVFFSTFNLWFFGFYLGFVLIMSLLKIILAIWDFIKSLLPLIVRLFA